MTEHRKHWKEIVSSNAVRARLLVRTVPGDRGRGLIAADRGQGPEKSRTEHGPLRRLRTVAAAVTVTVTVAGLAAACGGAGGQGPASSSTPGSASKGGTKLVYFIFNGYTPPYFAPMATGIKAANKYYPNLNIKILSANSSASQEVSQIKEAVAAGAKGIILNAVDASVTAATKQAATQGIPVVTIDRDVSDPSARFAFIGARDVKLGQQEATSCLQGAAAKNLPKPWHVVVLQGTLGSSTAVDRLKGTQEALKPYETKGTVKVALNQSANFDQATARSLMSEFLAKTTNIQMIIAGNDTMALGAIQALQTAHITPGKQVLVCGVDAQPESLQAIKTGTQYNTVTHSPYTEAVWAVEAMANDLTSGTKPPASTFPSGNVPIPQEVVTEANVASVSGWGTPATVSPLPYGKSSSHPSH